MYIVLYACRKCSETRKKFPFVVFEGLLRERAYYCTGIVKAIALFKPNALNISSNSPSDITIQSCDVNLLGIENFDTQIENIKQNVKGGDKIFHALDAYYDNNSVG